jgi:hypothetical protein
MTVVMELPGTVLLRRKLADAERRADDREAALRAARDAITAGRHGDALRVIRLALGNQPAAASEPAPKVPA